MRVGVAGALGRLGRVASAAVDAADGLDLVAAFDRDDEGELLADRIGCGGDARIHSGLDAFYNVKMDAIVDCTVYPVTVDVAHAAIAHGVKRFEGIEDQRITAAADAVGETFSRAVAIERGNQAKIIRCMDRSGRNAPEPPERAGNADAHGTRRALRERT